MDHDTEGWYSQIKKISSGSNMDMQEIHQLYTLNHDCDRNGPQATCSSIGNKFLDGLPPRILRFASEWPALSIHHTCVRKGDLHI